MSILTYNWNSYQGVLLKPLSKGSTRHMGIPWLSTRSLISDKKSLQRAEDSPGGCKKEGSNLTCIQVPLSDLNINMTHKERGHRVFSGFE